MPAKNAKYTHGYGSRKAAAATARLYKGKGNITINGKPALDFLSGKVAASPVKSTLSS